MPENQNFPTLSIIIVTRNVEKKLPYALASIKKQDYPRKKIEIIAVDGGSSDGTLNILKQFEIPIKIIQGKYPENQEARRAIGLKYAKGEIIAYIDSDNYLPHSLWLKKMIFPFLQHPDIVGTSTLRYHYRKDDTLLNRYFALLGSADPADFYLQKGERLSFLYDTWNRYGEIVFRQKEYFIVKFDPKFFPTLGANGFLARKSLWEKAHVTPDEYIHVDVAYDLALLGYQTYAIVNDSIIHDTATSFFSFLKKRATYVSFYQQRVGKRRYKVFDAKKADDVWNLFLFIFFSVTIFEPLLFSIRGFIKKRDIAWFIHPLYCIAVIITYTHALSRRFLFTNQNSNS